MKTVKVRLTHYECGECTYEMIIRGLLSRVMSCSNPKCVQYDIRVPVPLISLNINTEKEG